MKSYGTKSVAISAAVALLLGLTVSALDSASPGDFSSQNNTSILQTDSLYAMGKDTYYAISATYAFPVYSGETLTFPVAQALCDKDSISLTNDTQGYGCPVVQLQQDEQVSIEVQVPEDGCYALFFDFLDITDSILSAKLSIAIDGEYPFSELKNQILKSQWYYADEEFPLDRYGNQIIPISTKKAEWQQAYLSDSYGIEMQPLLLSLSEGKHTITYQILQGNVLIGNTMLGGQSKQDVYSGQTPSGSQLIELEGEKFSQKNDPGIRPKGEYNLDVQPYSTYSSVMNMLDGASFSSGGQQVTYSFVVEEAGYYGICIRSRQSQKQDFPVYRDIAVDDEIPCADFANVRFDYDSNFTNTIVKNTETQEALGLFLTAGKHTISLMVTLAPLREAIQRMRVLVNEINQMGLQVLKITGNNQEKYRDFDLTEYFPELKQTLEGWADEVQSIYDVLALNNPNASKIGELSPLLIAKKRLKDLAKRPNELPKRLSEFYSGDYSAVQYLSAVLESLYSSPMDVDRICVYQNETDLPQSSNWFYKFIEIIKRFFTSFQKSDYETTSEEGAEDRLQVWVGRSRQYVELIQQMADDSFYNQYKTSADVLIMPDQSKLVLANAAGNSPDIALGVSAGFVFDLAIRGALQNIREFTDSSEIEQRFHQGILTPGFVETGLYALPETTNFSVLFYRTDILERFGLQVPNTMADVKNMLPQLNRLGMDFYSHVSGSIGYKSFGCTLPFIYQQGGSLYGNTALDIQLNDEKTIDAMIEMTELFTIYNLPYEVANFYQGFRSGVMPIGVGDFSTYNLLLNSAPEIANAWDIALYPGYESEEGVVNRTITGAGESCFIFDTSNKKEQAWNFLKWWTDADTQIAFSDTLQLTYGKTYMWASANQRAFQELSINEQHKKVITEQMTWIAEAPRAPGSYMLERELSNAFNQIVLNRENPRACISNAYKTAKRETERKLEEFGYRKNGKTIKDYVISPSVAR